LLADQLQSLDFSVKSANVFDSMKKKKKKIERSMSWRAKIKPLSARSAKEKEKSKRDDEKNRAYLRSLCRLPANRECADCTAPNPNWAALPWGAFVCIDCAQIHRHIGRHISQVQNFATYLWHEDQVAAMSEFGNARVAQIYGGGVAKPKPSDPRSVREQYARDKYEHQRWLCEPKVDRDDNDDAEKKQARRQARQRRRESERQQHVGANVSDAQQATLAPSFNATGDDFFNAFNVDAPTPAAVATAAPSAAAAPQGSAYDLKAQSILQLFQPQQQLYTQQQQAPLPQQQQQQQQQYDWPF
jgi:stromal membrane-associated protein